jgi:hypothetical protein
VRYEITAEPRDPSQVGPCEICGGQSGTGTGFSPTTSSFCCQYHSTIASSTRCSYEGDKQAKAGNSFGSGGMMDRKVLLRFLCFDGYA